MCGIVNSSPVDEVPNTHSGDSPKRGQKAAPAQMREEEPVDDDTQGRHPRGKRAPESLLRLQAGKTAGSNKSLNNLWVQKHGTKFMTTHVTIDRMVWLRVSPSKRGVNRKGQYEGANNGTNHATRLDSYFAFLRRAANKSLLYHNYTPGNTCD